MTWILNFQSIWNALELSTYPPPSRCLWPLRSAIAEEFDLTALEKDSKLGGQVQLGTWDLWQVTKTPQTKRDGKSMVKSWGAGWRWWVFFPWFWRIFLAWLRTVHGSSHDLVVNSWECLPIALAGWVENGEPLLLLVKVRKLQVHLGSVPHVPPVILFPNMSARFSAQPGWIVEN